MFSYQKVEGPFEGPTYIGELLDWENEAHRKTLEARPILNFSKKMYTGE